MPDRLAELRRQRALVQEHLAWLDREIAAEAETAPDSTARGLAQSAASSSNETSRETDEAHASGRGATSDAILDEYRVAPESVHEDVRKGCFLYFFAAFAVLIVAIVVLYFALRKPDGQAAKPPPPTAIETPQPTR